ncbi:MAG TPA: hypothetical protein VFI03_06930 [Solirubrobacterales bacterium]|nr:hypothetical protein [Solirubrobacterales bacterium]
MKQIRKRLTYANVMSSIAVFLILGGATAFAATKIGANQLKANSVKTGKIVKEAVTAGKIKKAAIATSKLANDAVTTNKLANDAVTGAKAKESTFGEVPIAANANALGGLAPSGYQHNLRWAVVSASAGGASVIRGNATAATRLGPGAFTVSFAADIRACAYVATLGDVGAGASEPGEISVEQLASSNPTTVEVRTYNSVGTETDPDPGDGFHITVICP